MPGMMISVRPMQDKDEPVLQAMIAEMIGGANKEQVASQEVHRYQTHPDYDVYVAEAAGNVVAFGVIKNTPFEGSDNVAELGLFSVREALRGSGIGKALLQSIEAKLAAAGVKKLYTTTNPKNVTAARYWLGRGFEFEARLVKVNGDTDYYLLSKNLPGT